MKFHKASTKNTSSQNLSRFTSAAGQKRNFLILFLIFTALYILLKYCYTDPMHCLPDASGYIYAAQNHWKVNYRPYGYSAFLNLIHGIHRSMWFLTFSQYFLHALSVSLFIFTIQYVFSLHRRVFYAFMTLSVLSPASLYFTNYAISDSLFNSLSILWITTGIWKLPVRPVYKWIIEIKKTNCSGLFSHSCWWLWQFLHTFL